MKRTYVIGVILAIIILTAAIGIYWYSTLRPGGKTLTVGVSADYPPFESVNEKGTKVGFDVDLMYIIAGRLGYQVEWVDMAFGLLIGALKEGKFDLAMSSFAITPARLEQVDFSHPYFVTSWAILVRNDAPFNITVPSDITTHTVGTMKGSAQYEYLKNTWITNGTMSDSGVFLYERGDLAVMDLNNGRIDCVFLDKAGMSSYTKQYPVKIACTFQSGVNMGIAAPKGSQLLSEINSVIDDLWAKGILDALRVAWVD